MEFGTEVISSADGSLVALLGASPGASTAVDTMIGILETSFPTQMASEAWLEKLHAMVPSYGQVLVDDIELLKRVREYTLTTLKLTPP